LELTLKNVENIVEDNMGQFSTYVLLSRAIPDIRDGLKPSYRRVLWTMNEMKATRLTKSANIWGEVMRYHPHGSTYPTMVGMAQKDGQLNPYLIGKGNFGQHASELAYASDRYTELKLAEISIDMIADSKKNGVKMIDNYDSTRKIPEVFPVKYPSILAYAQSGIGVGFSSSIPSFNITELCQATIDYILRGEKRLLIPDFGTKAFVVNDEEILRTINENGRGSIVQRARVEIDGRDIIIKEIPYDTTKEKIIDKILKLYKEDKLKEVVKVDDISGLSGMQVVITAKKGIDMDMLLEKLYLNTPMQTTYSANMMVINTKGLPELKGVWSILDEWLDWRKDVITKMLEHDTKLKNAQLEILYGLNLIKDDIEEVISIIRTSTDDNLIKNLQKKFALSKIQAERISELKLRNLTTTFIKKQMASIGELEKQVTMNNEAIKSDEIKNQMIVFDLEETIKKFGKERQAEIIERASFAEIKKYVIEEKSIPDYNVKVFVTKENYVKKMALTSLRQAGVLKLKDSDEIILEVETTNTEEILIFTDKQNVYKKRLSELEDCKPNQLGSYIPNEISLESGETILAVLPLSESSKYVLIGYEDGKVAKIDVESYRTKQNRSVLKNGYADKSALLFDILGTENVDIIAFADNKKVVLMNTETINSKSAKTTQGVTFIKLKDGCTVEKYEFAEKSELPEKEYYRLKSAGTGKYIKK
jgi:DNA gyrase subunit A